MLSLPDPYRRVYVTSSGSLSSPSCLAFPSSSSLQTLALLRCCETRFNPHACRQAHACGSNSMLRCLLATRCIAEAITLTDVLCTTCGLHAVTYYSQLQVSLHSACAMMKRGRFGLIPETIGEYGIRANAHVRSECMFIDTLMTQQYAPTLSPNSDAAGCPPRQLQFFLFSSSLTQQPPFPVHPSYWKE